MCPSVVANRNIVANVVHTCGARDELGVSAAYLTGSGLALAIAPVWTLRMLASNLAPFASSHDAFFLVVLAVVGAGLMASRSVIASTVAPRASIAARGPGNDETETRKYGILKRRVSKVY
jgi:hypothetical protein